MYAEVAEQRGVPRGSILIEPRATNTAENIRFSRELLLERRHASDAYRDCCEAVYAAAHVGYIGDVNGPTFPRHSHLHR